MSAGQAARPLRIAVIAPMRYPIREPHAGGLESSIWNQVREFRARGHEVLLCAVEGSDFLEGGPAEFVLPAVIWDDPREATDSTYPAGYLDRAVPALEAALAFIATAEPHFDLVDNHSLHGVPLEWAERLGMPLVTTLHTPALPELVAAHELSVERPSAFVAVSRHTASEWSACDIRSTVIPNAVDTDRWLLGPGGDDLVWFGRIVPEKGAHLALEAARLAGRRIRLAGRIGDTDYFARFVAPALGDHAEYVGALRQPELAALVGRSACALVTPDWDEPFGLVIAEALSTGTPVASFDVGGVPEVVGAMPGTGLVPLGDVAAMAALAEGLIAETRADLALRARIREAALARFSLRRRAEVLEEFYAEILADDAHRSEPARVAP
jgi:glycosyltransferase involved in cell wall biosynthesis